ncbi:hypothetical protein [Georgenia wangjunii]|uniref:hypothetical protein n=1 Tax=Georgenia wangjunii TaxID=3117730 RepID=UPI002F268B22
MDPTLRQRLELFRTMDEVPAGVVDLVEDELVRVDPAGRLSDDSAGMFVSHAVMAFSRLLGDEDPVDAPSDAVFDQVLTEDPTALARAGALAERARQRLGRALPDAEVKYLTIHLAVLAQHLSKEN